MSIVHRGLPVFFRAVTIRWHQENGSPTGTASRTPTLTFVSIDAFTSCCQCRGTGVGLWTAIGLAAGSTWSSNSVPSIRESVWHSQVLKVLDRYLSSIQLWRAVCLASVAGNGKAVGNCGDLVRMGQEQSHSSSRGLAAADLTDMGC